MEYFTTDNTEGYTQEELNILNNSVGDKLLGLDQYNDSDEYKSVLEGILNNSDSILGKN